MGSITPSVSDPKQVFKTPWIETPLVESACLSRAAGCRIFLKLENVQPSGSFKSRAMGNQILSHLRNPAYANRPVHFYASSGGNAGLAAVCAARSLGYPCTVVVPVSTKPLMLEKLRAAGAADVVRHGETFSEAGEYMREVIMKNGSPGEEDVAKIALHPFDNQPIWEGNSTIVDELEKQLPRAASVEEDEVYRGRALPLDAVLCSVGGGGLLNGLVMGLEKRRCQKQKDYTSVNHSSSSSSSQPSPIHLLAIETAGTDSLAAAVAKNSLVSLPRITSQATSLGAIRVSETTFQYAVAPPPGIKVHSTVLSDADAARGVLRLADDERLLVELACGVCVEAAIGDASTATSVSGAAGTGGQSTKKRKRGSGSPSVSHRDEGYGDDRLSSTENETDQEHDPDTGDAVSSAVPRFQSKLKQLVPDLNPQSRVVIIVCGGSNVTIDMAGEWRKMLQEGWV
ncbi:Tryptophan synthase beta subunit-like PLP-dependent enzymes superfamily [Penicillium alfredii]|uniref:L-serine ammonia-lyase n=1 Tax=Penicillium alfredii TaxID=1506179 RepID=A0A9W9F9U4_9EURO|nr:Tryptophan synthase beta subunit-like PLP-dependent enzymes superfamily [Penicillium alfredii]KAJ5096094.1 Tryptophan synthase beta subunit-like PLP-dependent enzymes superfamily [Penicillium alfredii]